MKININKKKLFIITPILLCLMVLIIFSKDYNTMYSKKPAITNNDYKNFLLKNKSFKDSCLGEIENTSYYNSLYNETIRIIHNLERNGFISRKFKNELFSLLKNGKMHDLLSKIETMSFTKINQILLSDKLLLQAVISDMVFEKNKAEELYKLSIENNKFNYKAYFYLSKFYKRDCKYNDAIDILLNVSSVLNNNNQRDELNILYSELGNLYFDLRDYYNALSSYTNALISLDIKNVDVEKYNILIKIGDIMFNRGNIVDSIDYYKYALSLNNRKISREENIDLLLKLSNVYYSYGNYYNGLKFAKAALKKSKTLKSNLLSSKAHYFMCLNYEYLNEKEKAKYNCMTAKKLIENENSVESYIHLANMLSFVSYLKNDDLAVEYYTRALNAIKNNIILKTYLMEKIATIKSYRLKQDTMKDFDNLEKMYNNYNISSNCCNNIVKGLFEERVGSKEEAEKFYLKAETDSKYNYISLATLYSYMSDYYKSNGDNRLALFYGQKALNIAKNIYKYDHHYIKYYKNRLDNISMD